MARSPNLLINSKKGLRVGYPAQLILMASKTPYKDIIQHLLKERGKWKRKRKKKKEQKKIKSWTHFVRLKERKMIELHLLTPQRSCCIMLTFSKIAGFRRLFGLTHLM